MPTGPLPTTSYIYVIQHGPALTHRTSPSTPHSPPLHLLTSPHPLLTSLTLIDTPGTNALSRVHESLTRNFLPRADLILLVTSAERPFAESERLFLQGVKEWRRRVVVVVGKVDLLEGGEGERRAVEAYVREGVNGVLHLGDDLRVLMVSTREPQSVAALERFIRERVGVEGVYLKLRSPLGVVERVLDDAEGEVQREVKVWRLKAATVEEVREASADYRRAALDEYERSVQKVENIFLRMQDRSIRWIDEHGSLLQVGEWLRGPAQMQRRYTEEVWTDVKEEVERALVGLLDGLSDCRGRHLRRIQARLQQAQDELEHSNHQTLRSLQASTADILASQQAPTSPSSSASISSALSTSLFASAALNTGALSLAVSSLLSLSILDLTFLSSGLLALAGLSLMPWRRRQLSEVIRVKGREMHERLAAVMKVEVEAEMERVDRRVRRGMEGLEREVDKEGVRVKAAKQELDDLRAEWKDLTQQVEALQPNRVRRASAQ